MDFVDLDLARRMEMAEAHACRACAESFQQQHPDFPVAVQEIAGGFAVFAGVDSPVTQAIGVGLHGDVSDSDLDRLRDFFHSRGAAAAVELCPLVPMSLYERFAKRGYQLLEVSDVLFRKLTALDSEVKPPPSGVSIRRAAPDESKLWTKTVSQGFAEHHPGDAVHPRRDGRFLSRRPMFHRVSGRRCRRRRRTLGARRSLRPFRRQHAAGISRSRRAKRVAKGASRVGCSAGLRCRREYRAAGERLASQYRASRISRRLYTHKTNSRGDVIPRR